MQVSVVVPTFNRREIVLRTVKTLFNQDFPSRQYEIIVVVDGSTDGSAEALRALEPSCQFRVIEQENRGLAGARNTGFRVSESELVIFLDDDMLCDPILISEHYAAHQSNGEVIGFGAIFLSADSPPTLAAECFNREVGAYYLQQRENPGLPWPRTACIFGNTSVPRRLLIESGGFDERFLMREDAERGARLFAAGAVARYLPKAVAHQIYRKTAADLIRDAEKFAIADRLFVREHPESVAETLWGRISREPLWKRIVRRSAAECPALADCILVPFCWLCEQIELLRAPGARALQVRRIVYWYRKTLELNCGDASVNEHLCGEA
ncbi:MAG: hypothetical protein CXZ00_15060 [Acidobacteria bacterium]|nr:MAG: hypothetical protein CXZ00_15060 [Acidobacteriota bacterium]